VNIDRRFGDGCRSPVDLTCPVVWLFSADRFSVVGVLGDTAGATAMARAQTGLTVAEWAPRWLATKKSRQARTYYDLERALASRIIPRFGHLEVASITRADIQTWVSELVDEGLSGSRVRNLLNPLKMMLDLAVEEEIIDRNPARPRSLGGRTGMLELPPVRSAEQRYCSADEIRQLAEAAGAINAQGRVIVYTLGYAGMRWSELVELQRRDFELARGRLEVTRKAVEVSGRHVVDVRKRGGRARPRVPAFVRDLLAEHLATLDEDPATLLFPGRPHLCHGVACERIRYKAFRRDVWAPAVAQADIGHVTPHQLRHSAAALLVAAGADPKAVATHLGHSTISVTMNTYAHLFEDHLDDVMDRLDAEGRTAGLPVGRQ